MNNHVLIIILIIASLLVPINQADMPTRLDTTNRTLSTGYYMVLMGKNTDSEPIYSYRVFNINNSMVLTVLHLNDIMVFKGNNNTKITLSTVPRHVLPVGNYLVIVGYSRPTITVTLFNIMTMKIVDQKTVEENNMVPTSLAEEILEGSELFIGIEAVKISQTGKYLVKFTINLDSDVINYNGVEEVSYESHYYGNIGVYSDEETPQTINYTGITVNITAVNSSTIISALNKTVKINATPLLDEPIVINRQVIVLMNKTGKLAIATLNNTGEYIYPTNIDSRKIYGFYAAYDYLAIIQNNGTITYYDPIHNNTIALSLPAETDLSQLFIVKGIDNDTLPDPIIHIGNLFYAYYTIDNSLRRTGFDYQLELMNSPYNLAILKGSIQIILVGYNRTNRNYSILNYTLAETVIDETPPNIAINNPVNQSVINGELHVEAKASDPESGICCVQLQIENESSTIGKLYYSSILDEYYNLTPGEYRVNITAWNNQGLSSWRILNIYIVNNSILILAPNNYSYIRNILELTIQSAAQYNVTIYINNTLIGEETVSQGINTYRFNLSGLPDGPLILRLEFTSGNKTIRIIELIVVKDSVKPLIMVDGLDNNTILSSKVAFNITVQDKNYDSTTVKLNNTLIAEINTSKATIVIDTRRFENGYYHLVINARDKAGNNSTKIFDVWINNTVAEPIVSITPTPPNNTYVEGVLSFNLTLQNTIITTVLLDNETVYAIYGDRTVRIVINTSKYPDGTHSFTINATGPGGIVRVYRYIWLIDNHPPKLRLTINAFRHACSAPITIPWRNNSFVPVYTIIPGVGIKYFLEKTSNGILLDRLYLNITDEFLDYAVLKINNTIIAEFNESGGHYLTPTLPGEGKYVAVLEAWDGIGHYSETRIIFYIDMTPPSLTVYSPKNHTLTNNTIIHLEFKGVDNLSPTLIPGVIISKIPVDYISPCALLPIPNYLQVLNNSLITVNLTLRHGGKIHLYIAVIDQAGNIAVKHLVLTIDNQPPVINATIKTIGNKVFINAFINDDSGEPPDTTLWINETMVKTTMKVINNTEVINETITLKPGKYVIIIRSRDVAGNTAEYSKVIVIKQPVTPPENTTTSQTSGGVNKTSNTTGKPGSSNNNLAIGLAATIVLILAVVGYLLWRRVLVNTSPAPSSQPGVSRESGP